jgi:hypothetical protein
MVLRTREDPRGVRVCQYSWLEGHFPQVGIRIAISCEDDGVAVRNLDMLFVEACGASVVAQEAKESRAWARLGNRWASQALLGKSGMFI